MNKRIKKKRNRTSMTGILTYTEFFGNIKTPHWKRIKASGRKRKMYYDIHCIYTPNRNHRVYDPVLVRKALKEYFNEQEDSKKAIQVTCNDLPITNGAMEYANPTMETTETDSKSI